MNITNDNYEAYLLDYMEGNLSPEGAAQLKAFVAAQGMDWDELIEPLPHLEAPDIAFEGMEKLKQKPKVVPLYVKIASAAAAAGLLLTVTLWPEKSLPKVEPIAELQPLKANLTLAETMPRILPRRSVLFVSPQPIESSPIDKQEHPKAIVEKAETLALAELPPLKPKEITSPANTGSETELKMEMLRYRMETDWALAMTNNALVEEQELPTSFIGRAIYRWSEGRYASVNDLVNAGLHRTKQEIAIVTTEMAMEAQQRAEENIADAREYWKSKREE